VAVRPAASPTMLVSLSGAGDVRGMRVREALEIAILGGAGNLGRDDVGRLAPGYAADFVAWKVGRAQACLSGWAGAGGGPGGWEGGAVGMRGICE
jgi:cytosine/adenosine deaminase-related metal-dependent hydrolase